MTKYFYFYDKNEVLIDRYPAKISKYLLEKYGKSNFIFVYSEKGGSFSPKNIPAGSKSFFIPDLSIDKIKLLFQKYPPNSLITIAQRIPDLLMMSIFNTEMIPTFTVQHGLWSDHLERISIPRLLINKFSKIKNYLYYSKKICLLNKLPYVGTIIDFYNFFIKENINISDSKYLDRDNLRAKTAFVFDDSWNDYYTKKFGYQKKNIVYIGNPDFMLLKDLKKHEKEDAVCYICQTLVEDGRYSEGRYKKFLYILNDAAASEKKLYIKLHPRSNRQLYECLKSNKNITITNEFPLCDYYIGHYSGMLAVAKQCSGNVLIWNLANHHMPKYFYQFASIICENSNILNSFVKGEIESQRENQTHVLTEFEINQLNPIKIIGNYLYNQYEHVHP